MEDAIEDRQDDLTQRHRQALLAPLTRAWRHILERFVTHLHDFVRGRADRRGVIIRFLSPTPATCATAPCGRSSRHLGVSMLVDAINHRHASATASTVLGLFLHHRPAGSRVGEDMAVDGRGGEPALVHGWPPLAPTAAPSPARCSTCGRPRPTECTWPDPRSRSPTARVLPHRGRRMAFRPAHRGPRQLPHPHRRSSVGRMPIATGRHPELPAHVHFMRSPRPAAASLVTHLFRRGRHLLF